MSKETYTFVRTVGPKDWVALPREFKAGETIVHYDGHTYGCDRDDAMAGYDVIACSLDGEAPFFTVPVDMIHNADGKHPLPTYVRF